MNLELQIKELNGHVQTFADQKAKYEEDLKASIDKVFDLREIIADLETQIQSKTLNENVLGEKCRELENYIEHQNQANESLKEELDDVRKMPGHVERIRYLEDQLKLARPTAEQKLLTDQMTSQLKTIEMLLDRKTKTLEAFHALASTCSTTCSSPSEDVSRGNDLDSDQSPMRVVKMSTEGSFLPFEEVQRILEKLSKHNRIEEATVKKVTDLEMQVNGMRANYNVSFKINFSKFFHEMKRKRKHKPGKYLAHLCHMLAMHCATNIFLSFSAVQHKQTKKC